MENKKCPQCGSTKIEETIYQETPRIDLIFPDNPNNSDTRFPQIKRKCTCQDCEHVWREFV